MRTSSLVFAASLLLAPFLHAGHDGESTIWVTRVKGAIDSGWTALTN